MKLTIFILSINRHENIKKSLSYWSKSNYKIFILDASQNALEVNFPKNINYIHKPHLSMFKRCKIALSLLKTEFFCFCADDDYHIIDNLKYFYQVLDKNFSSAQGIIYKFGRSTNETKFLYTAYTNVYKSIVGENWKKRILYFSKNSMMPLCYSICKKSVLKTFCDLTSNLEKSPQFVLFEELFAISIMIEGNFKFIKLPYGFRLQHPNRYLTSSNYDSNTLEQEFKKNIFKKKLKLNITKVLKQKYKIKDNTIILLILNNFLTNYQNKIKNNSYTGSRKMINQKKRLLNLRILIKKIITILITNKINYNLYKSFINSWKSI
jgi:glycosyltransferase domain-containing protein